MLSLALSCVAETVDLYGDFVANATRADVGGPVDIAREDRIRRCHDAKRLFATIRKRLPALRDKFAHSRKVGDLASKLDAKCLALAF